MVEAAQLLLVDGLDGGEVGVELALARDVGGFSLPADLGVDPGCARVRGVVGPHQRPAQRAASAACRRRHRRWGLWGREGWQRVKIVPGALWQ